MAKKRSVRQAEEFDGDWITARTRFLAAAEEYSCIADASELNVQAGILGCLIDLGLKKDPAPRVRKLKASVAGERSKLDVFWHRFVKRNADIDA